LFSFYLALFIEIKEAVNSPMQYGKYVKSVIGQNNPKKRISPLDSFDWFFWSLEIRKPNINDVIVI
jgi:hypothetical protein